MNLVLLKNLHCHVTEDAGADELYMVSSTTGRFWPPSGIFSMREGQDAPFPPLALVMPGDSIFVELFDEDDPDQDDNLGRATFRASDAGRGDLTVDFTADEAHYTLTYSVQTLG